MSNYDDFLEQIGYAESGLMEARLAASRIMNDYGNRVDERDAALDQVTDLEAEVARLTALVPAPVVNPLDYKFPGMAPAGRAFFTYGDGTGPFVRTEWGVGVQAYKVAGIKYRRETGIKHPTLAMIGPEPEGDFEYRFKIRPAPTWQRLSSKVVVAQFWSKSDEPPRLSLEFVGDVQRWVWIHQDKSRITVAETPLITALEWVVMVRAGMATVSMSNASNLTVSWGGQPTVKFGAYYPAGREGSTAEAEVWVESVERRAL